MCGNGDIRVFRCQGFRDIVVTEATAGILAHQSFHGPQRRNPALQVQTRPHGRFSQQRPFSCRGKRTAGAVGFLAMQTSLLVRRENRVFLKTRQGRFFAGFRGIFGRFSIIAEKTHHGGYNTSVNFNDPSAFAGSAYISNASAACSHGIRGVTMSVRSTRPWTIISTAV